MIKRDILIKAVFFLFLTCSISFAGVDTYYVTQGGAGGQDGTSLADAWAVSDFNTASNWDSSDNASKIDPGDTVYFSGTITTTLEPQGSGTAGNYITLDGYEADNTTYMNLSEAAGRALIQLTFDTAGEWGFSIGVSNDPGRSYLIIQDFEVKDYSHGILSGNGSNYIIVRRNYFHNGGSFGIDSTSYTYGPNYYWTIGGAPGQGNVVKNNGTNTAGGDIQVASGSDYIISYNHCYADLSPAVQLTSAARGIDGIVASTDSRNVLIEYNSSHGHLDNYGSDAKGEDGIDCKEDTYNVIIRYNHIYNNRQANIGISSDDESYDIFIYGNYLHGSNWGSLYNTKGVLGSIYFFSNISYNEVIAGICGEAGTWNVFNNTFIANATDGSNSSHTNIRMLAGTWNVNNNIIYKSRPSETDYRQIYAPNTSGKTLNYNWYYWYDTQARDSIVNWGGSNIDIDALQVAGQEGWTANNEGDPGLTDIGGGDYTISSTGSAVYGVGTNLSEQVGYVTITGGDGVENNYPVYTYIGLDPDGTDWTTTPPTVATLNRDDYQWDIGAYVFETADVTAPTITFSYPNSDRACTSDPRDTSIGGTTDEAANCRIGTTDEGDYDLMPAESMDEGATFVTSHVVTPSLACDAAYTYYMYCEDSSGNESAKATISFSILSGSPPAPDDPGTMSGGGMSGGSM